MNCLRLCENDNYFSKTALKWRETTDLVKIIREYQLVEWLFSMKSGETYYGKVVFTQPGLYWEVV